MFSFLALRNIKRGRKHLCNICGIDCVVVKKLYLGFPTPLLLPCVFFLSSKKHQERKAALCASSVVLLICVFRNCMWDVVERGRVPESCCVLGLGFISRALGTLFVVASISTEQPFAKLGGRAAASSSCCLSSSSYNKSAAAAAALLILVTACCASMLSDTRSGSFQRAEVVFVLTTPCGAQGDEHSLPGMCRRILVAQQKCEDLENSLGITSESIVGQRTVQQELAIFILLLLHFAAAAAFFSFVVVVVLQPCCFRQDVIED